MDIKWRNPFKKKSGVDPSSSKEKEIKDYYDIEPIDSTNAVYRMIIG